MGSAVGSSAVCCGSIADKTADASADDPLVTAAVSSPLPETRTNVTVADG